MILLDADVILIDRKFTRDARHARNREAIDRLKTGGHEVGGTTQALLEVVGMLSFNTPDADIPQLPELIVAAFGLAVVPAVPEYAGVTVAEVTDQMTRRMALGDAVLAVQVAKFAPAADALLTWNAKHFRGKMAVPVLTPDEWLISLTLPAGPTP